MLKKLIWNDVQQNKLLSAATVFFMAVSAMMPALTALLFSGLLNMMGNLNLTDNILLPATQANRSRGRKSKEEWNLRVHRLMEKLGIAGLEKRRITQVSGGQLQRACICRSMMNGPEILFADEPTGSLNKSAAAEVMGELVRLNREGTTILMVTHDSRIAGSCDRIIYLLDGRIFAELTLGKAITGAEKRREEKVSRWLMEMGW